MKDISAYNMKTRKKTTMNNPKLVTLKNGRKAVVGMAADDHKTTLYRILSTEEARKFRSQ